MYLKNLLSRMVSIILGCYLLLNSSPIQAGDVQKQTDSQKTFWQWKTLSSSYATHYIEKGKGTKHIVLIHGFAAHSFTWKSLMEDLAKAGYHVWALDLLGFGLSDKPLDVYYNLDLFTTQIEAFMEGHTISSASIVGNSMGGGLALALSIQYPQRVQSLVLLDALVFPIKFPFYFAVAKFFGAWAKPFFGKTLIKQVLKEITYDPKKITEEQIEAYALPFRLPGGKDAFINTLRNFDDRALTKLAAHFKNIHVPLLIIWGEQDTWMPLSYYQQVVKAFPLATHVLIPHCGHAPQEECPLKVEEAILNFYKTLH